MRFFTIGIAIAAYRNYSTKGFSKPSYGSYSKFKNKNKTTESKQRGPRIEWTEEQKSVLSAVTRGKSVFITGSAGTGKTKLLTEVVKLLKNLHGPSKVFVTASTGVAAFALKGQTLHSFAGIGLATVTDDPEDLLDKISINRRACRRWQKVEALVIDEISMVDARLFAILEYIAKKLRGEGKTWGGIQLVVSGDFCQLPPVPDNGSQGIKYAFEANCWNESFDLQIELTKIFRQSDLGLIKLLQGIRMGETDPEDLELLERYCSETECDPSVVRLFPLNTSVKRVNDERLKSLQKDVCDYTAVDDGVGPWKRQVSLGIAPDKLSICEGARVMLVKNLSTWKGLVNGATGTVVGFSKAGEKLDGMCRYNLLPIVKFDSGKTLTIEPEKWNLMDGDEVVASRKQIPLILSWALSIHKCQGMTLDRAYINLSGAFGCGMVYTALSRLRSLEGLHLSGFKPSKIRANPKALKFYRRFALQHSSKDLEVSCIENKDSSTSIIGASEKAGTEQTKLDLLSTGIVGPSEKTGTSETKLDLLSQFLSRRLKRS